MEKYHPSSNNSEKISDKTKATVMLSMEVIYPLVIVMMRKIQRVLELHRIHSNFLKLYRVIRKVGSVMRR